MTNLQFHVVLLHVLTAIISVLVVAVFFCLYWSVLGPDGPFRRWLCSRFHGDRGMFAGGKTFSCWCGLVFRTPWRES